MVIYRVDIAEPHRHEYQVTLCLPDPAREQRLAMPAWIPGSYMVRDFGRYVAAFEARQDGRDCPWEQLDKNTWQVQCEGSAPLEVSYRVHALDPTARGAWLDAERGFFNGTSLCLRAHGHENAPHRLVLGPLPDGWEAATAMARVDESTYGAADYDELVDHPFELGRFWRGCFEAAGIAHEFVVTGAMPHFDGDRMLADARRICEAQIHFWHGRPGLAYATRPPFARYVFLLHAVDDGSAGLEHRASTALVAGRDRLPVRDDAGNGEGYVRLLGLVSHEYFHAWNVKRLKPAELAALDYGRENYTALLWFFEGFTAYYDDLFLVRAGLVTPARYLRLLQEEAVRLARMPGRRLQSAAQASFDTWVKHAVAAQEPHTANMTTNYYLQGALIALALDLSLRLSAGGPSLDTVMLRLWLRSAGGPVREADILGAVRDLAGEDAARSLSDWVHARTEPPLRELLAEFGVRWQDEPATGLADGLGVRTTVGPREAVQLSVVLRDGAAERAGLAPGDQILAVQGWRVDDLEEARPWLRDGEPCELLVARGRRVFTARAELPGADHRPRLPALSLSSDAPAEAATRRRHWLGR